MEIDFKNRTGLISMKSDHSLFIGNRPKAISNDMMARIIENEALGKKKVDISAFGLFETATPNYTTYYPDVKPEDLTPSNEDFIYPIFRCLSATVVYKGYKPIDFSKPNVLKNSMGLLVGQTINADHETALGNGMGVVKSVSWQNAYEVEGIKIPAGINGEFMIDGKSNPRISRAIMSNPPIIHSNSVSVKFTWSPSHKVKSDEDFYGRLGTLAPDGTLYRLMVDEILQYSETSLVPHGADPYAQVVRNGVINNPKYAAGVYSFSAKEDDGKEMKLSHFMDYKLDLTADTILPSLYIDSNKPLKTRNMELTQLLEVAFGLPADSLKDVENDKITEAITNFTDKKVGEATAPLNSTISTLTGERDGLAAEKLTLQGTIDTLKLKEAEAAKYAEIILGERKEAKRLYSLAKGDDKKDEILLMLDTCEPAILESLSAEYKLQVEAKFPDTCKKCGSHELSKSSAFINQGGDPPAPVPQTINNLKEDLRKTARDKNKLPTSK